MQCLSPRCLMAAAPESDSLHLPAPELQAERPWVKGTETPQIPHESEISSYKLCTTITSSTTVCQPGIELGVVYRRKMCFSVLVKVAGLGAGGGKGAGRGCVYILAFPPFLWIAHSLRAVHGACGVRRYKAAFF